MFLKVLSESDSFFQLWSFVIDFRGHDVEQLFSERHLEDYVKENGDKVDLDIIIVDVNKPGMIKKVHELLDSNSLIPSIIYSGSSNALLNNFKHMKKGAQYLRLPTDKGTDSINTALNRLIKVRERAEKRREGYQKVKIPFMKLFKKAPCNMYLEVGEKKTVLIYRKGEELVPADLDKYKTRGAQRVCVKESDFEFLMSEVFGRLNSRIDVAQVPTSKLKSLSDLGVYAFHQCLGTMEISEKTLSIADSSINAMFEASGKWGSAGQFLRALKSRGNYFQEHPMLVYVIALEIAIKMGFDHNTTAHKLSCACFFHDMALKSEEFAEIRDVEDKNLLNRFGSTSIKQIRNHPLESSKLLSPVQGIPEDTFRIIENHHEKQDGTGFPRGLDYKRIDPLSTIFIVAEEFIANVYFGGFEANQVSSVIADMAGMYTKGNFLTVMEVLRSIVAKDCLIGHEVAGELEAS